MTGYATVLFDSVYSVKINRMQPVHPFSHSPVFLSEERFRINSECDLGLIIKKK